MALATEAEAVREAAEEHHEVVEIEVEEELRVVVEAASQVSEEAPRS